MMRKPLFALCALFLSITTILAQPSDSVKFWMDEGERLFNEGQFETSKQYFLKVISVADKTSRNYCSS